LGIGDSALHRSNSQVSQAQRKRQLDRQAALDTALQARRDALRQEYEHLVEDGKLRSPTHTEHLVDTAHGNPDNEAVQAARRLLAKLGIGWE
jgi:hypothetical protein